MNSISTRAKSLIANPSPIVVGHMKCVQNPYSNENPKGHLNFGIAQNHLMQDETVHFIKENNYFTNKDIHYNAGFGKLQLREAFSSFGKRFLGINDIDPNMVTVQTGVSSLCESLAYCLFDKGETLLMPAPYYPGFVYDFSRRFEVNIEIVDLKEENNFKHNIDDFKQAILKYKPKAILMTHPYNPTGESLDKNFTHDLVQLCKEKNIHIITDEIYALSRLNGESHNSLMNYDYDNIHLLYGMAKDFTLAGLKIGFFYTKDKLLSEAMQNVSYFHTTSTQTQNTIELMLKNQSFIENYIKNNQIRIQRTYQKIVNSLPSLIHTKPDAGIFFFANFKHLLKENTEKAEMELFDYFINELKINMTPGSAMGMKDYGFFRVCFAKEEAHINEFIRRLSSKTL